MKTLNKKQLLQLSKRYGCNVKALAMLQGKDYDEILDALGIYKCNRELPLALIMDGMYELIYNAIKCPDGTILRSEYRHDYKEHTQEDGRVYICDGGLDYQRCGGDDWDYKNLAVTYIDTTHEQHTEYLKWGSYGKNGDELLTHIKIKDMTTGHIKAVMKNVPGIKPVYKLTFMEELKNRRNVK